MYTTPTWSKVLFVEILTSLSVQLSEWKSAWRKSLGEPFITPWVFNNASLQMQPNGAGHGQWPWMLKTPDIALVHLYRASGTASARCGLSSQYTLVVAQVLRWLVDLAQQLLGLEVFGQEMRLQPSEAHLCADIAGWSDVTTLDRRINFVSRSRKRATHFRTLIGISTCTCQ